MAMFACWTGRSDKYLSGRPTPTGLTDRADQYLDRLSGTDRAELGESFVQRRLTPPAVVEPNPLRLGDRGVGPARAVGVQPDPKLPAKNVHEPHVFRCEQVRRLLVKRV